MPGGADIKSRLRSFVYAFNGLKLMLKGQYNFFIHIIIALIAIALGFYFDLSRAEWLWIILSIGMVFSAEIFNTSIEHLTDLAHAEPNPLAGKVKDLAAAAVLVASVTALIIGLIIFIPYLR
jgi:diacylglycerol kinase (ATP)